MPMNYWNVPAHAQSFPSLVEQCPELFLWELDLPLWEGAFFK